MDIALVGGSEEQLLSSLDFKLPPSSNYILERRQNKFFPSGASTFAPTGVRVARILLSGSEGWIAPETIKIGFNLTNNEAANGKHLILAGSPGTVCQRIRVLIAGTVVEDIDYYNRAHTLYEKLKPWNWNINDAVQSNLQEYDTTQTNFAWHIDSKIIAPGQSAKVLWTPALGLLKSNKYLPIKYAPVTLEITFANADDVVLNEPALHPDQHATVSTQNYTISQLEVFCSQLMLDSSLENSYANMLLQNRSLTMAFRTTLTQVAVIPDNSTTAQISLVRALSRLDALFVTFTCSGSGVGGTDHQAVSFFNPSARATGGGDKEYSHQENNLEFQVQVGSSLFPVSPATSMGEHFYRLLETLDLLDQNLRSISITPQDYLHNSFILGTNLSKAPGVSFSGLNVRTGDLTTLKIKNLRGNLTGLKCYIFQLSTQLVEIRESGVSVFD